MITRVSVGGPVGYAGLNAGVSWQTPPRVGIAGNTGKTRGMPERIPSEMASGLDPCEYSGGAVRSTVGAEGGEVAAEVFDVLDQRANVDVGQIRATHAAGKAALGQQPGLPKCLGIDGLGGVALTGPALGQDDVRRRVLTAAERADGGVVDGADGRGVSRPRRRGAGRGLVVGVAG